MHGRSTIPRTSGSGRSDLGLTGNTGQAADAQRRSTPHQPVGDLQGRSRSPLNAGAPPRQGLPPTAPGQPRKPLPIRQELRPLAATVPIACEGSRPDRVILSRPGEGTPPPLRVKPATLRNLSLAHQIIDAWSHQHPLRWGNQLSDIVGTKGMSWARLGQFTNWCNKHYGGLPLDSRIKAEAALRMQGFNCIGGSAVAFTEAIRLGAEVPVLHVQVPDHAYVLIGDPTNPESREEDIVVLDLWPKFPVPHTLRDARIKFPLRRREETIGDYENRCEAEGFSVMHRWEPGKAGFLDGYALTPGSVAEYNHDGVPFARLGGNAGEEAGAPPHDDDMEARLVVDDSERTVRDDDQDSLDGLGVDADLEPGTAQARPASSGDVPDPADHLKDTLGLDTDTDPVEAIVSRPAHVDGHMVSEWLFSTNTPGRGYITDEPTSTVVAFNEFPKERWDAWQGTIAEVLARGLLERIPPNKLEFFDLRGGGSA